MRFFLFIIILSVFIGCTRKSLSSADLIHWVETKENGLHKEKLLGPFKIAAQYRPISYIISKENKHVVISSQLVTKRTKQLNGMEYFQIRITSNNNTDPLLADGCDNRGYDLKNNFMMFQQRDYVYMLRSNDTIPCRLYQFINYQGMAPYVDIMLGFEAPKNDSQKDAERELVYDDQVFGFGPVHFSFSEKEINSTPILLATKQ